MTQSIVQTLSFMLRCESISWVLDGNSFYLEGKGNSCTNEGLRGDQRPRSLARLEFSNQLYA